MPKLFARLDSKNRVVELVEEVVDITKEWHPSFLSMCVDVTNFQTKPEIGWERKGNGQFAPYIEPEWPVDIKARSALILGLTANGHLYETFGDRWNQMLAETQHVTTFDEFSTGNEYLDWQDKNGEVVHFATTNDFLSVVKSLSRLVSKWQRYGRGELAQEPEKEV